MAATKGLGELFVELGLKGLGKTLGGLNAISAQFLLTKNAAEQAIKPIIGFSKEASSRLVGYDKINAVTGLSVKRLQEMDRWAKLNNVDFNAYVGQVQGLQQSILKFRLEGVRNKGFDILGIDPSAFDYRKPEEALRIISKRVTQLDEATGALALSYLGLDANLMYAFTHANREIDKEIALTDMQNAKLMEQNKQWNYFNDVVTQLKDKIATTGPIAQGLQYLIDLGKEWIHIIDDTDGRWTNFKNNMKDTFGWALKIYDVLKEVYLLSNSKEERKKHPFASWFVPYNLSYEDVLDAQINKTGLAGINTLPNPNISNSSKKVVNNNEITINQTITGNNAEAISYLVSDRLQQDLNNAKFNNGAVQ